MKKKILALLLAIFAVCPLLVACGSHYKYDTYQDFITISDPEKISIKKSDIDNGILGMYYDYFEDEITNKTLVSTVGSGEVRYGDTVQIDYSGYKIGATEAFEGGTATDYELEIGSGSFIDGFESGLIGHVVGEKVRLYLNFPANYKSADLAGQRVYFDVTIDKITKRYDYSPMTNETITEQSGGKYTTVEAFKADAEKTVIKNLIWSKYYEGCSVTKWPSKELREYYDTALENLKDQAMLYGGLDYYAQKMGYTDGVTLRSYVMQQARQQCKQDLMVLAYIEKYDLEPSKDVLKKMMKDLYEEAKKDGFEGSYRKYLKEYDESAVRISAYTDIMIEHMLTKYKTENHVGKNGFFTIKSSDATLVYYYVNDVKQTGWVEIDLEQDGVNELYYFNENENLLGLAFCNVSADVPVRGGAEGETRYHTFGENGKCLDDKPDNKLIFDGNGYMYLKDLKPVTGKQELNLTDAIEGNETYLFNSKGYRYDSIYLKLKDGAPNGILQLKDLDGIDNSIFVIGETDYTGKYYDFGVNGIFDPVKNGLAGGENGAIINDRYYKNGELKISDTYQVEGTNDIYYFDEKGDMVRGKLQDVTKESVTTKHYFDTDGKMVMAEEGQTIEITIKIDNEDIIYVIDDKGVAIEKPETPDAGE